MNNADTRTQNPHEPEGRGIPFDMVQELLDKCPYGSVHSVALRMLFYTGCRIAELDKMKRSNIVNGYIFWKCGKNQCGESRKEYLPDVYLKELQAYWGSHRVPGDRVFGVVSATYSRYFRREIRPLLSPRWHDMRDVFERGTVKQEYYFQLKGFRKNFATLLFCYFWRKYGDAGVALELVCKRMRHSNTGITIHHYIETMEQIQAGRFMHLMPFEIIQNIRQRSILDYYCDAIVRSTV